MSERYEFKFATAPFQALVEAEARLATAEKDWLYPAKFTPPSLSEAEFDLLEIEDELEELEGRVLSLKLSRRAAKKAVRALKAAIRS